MKLKCFKSNKPKRPIDVFEEPWLVYKLKPRELQSLKLLRREKHFELHKSFVYDMSVECFEITFTRGSKTYSLYRSKSEEDAEDVFDGCSLKLVAVMKAVYEPPSGTPYKQLLHSVMKCCRDFPAWEASHIAAHLGLWAAFADRVADVVERLNTQSGDGGDTPLHIALEAGHKATVKAILSLKPKLDVTNGQGNSILHQASLTSKPLFKTIWIALGIQAPIMMNWRNIDNSTPFHLACYAKKTSIVTYILQLGLTPDQMMIPPPDPETEYPRDSDPIDPTDRFFFPKSMIKDLDLNEVQYGGSPMHWVKTRETLDKLLILGLNPETKNVNGESVLHVFTRNKRFKCVIGALIADYKTDQLRDKNLETPLHTAVRSEDISIVQAIIAFDVDVNAINDKGQSPRHLASVQKSQLTNMILFMLNSIGAKRCPPGFPDCEDGCKHDGSFNGVKWSKWVLFDGCTMYKQPLMESIIEEAIKEREDQSDVPHKNRMLSLDGGGIRGLVTITILCELANYLKYPLFNYFDWTIGTSTGSLICSLICLKHSPQDIRSLYFRFKDKVAKEGKPYSSKTFDQFLQSVVGESRVMNSIRDRKLAITSTLADRIPSQLHLFRSYPSPKEILAKSSISKCEQQYLWSACRASGSAPLYFSTYNNFIDGGIVANNPTLDGLTEYVNWKEAVKSSGDHPPDLGVVVNIGTGMVPTTNFPEPVNLQPPVFSVNLRKTYRNLWAIWFLLKVMYEQCTLTDRQVVDRSMAWCTSAKIPHFRLCPPTGGTVPLDVVDDEEIINLIFESKAYMYSLRGQVAKLARLLDYGETPSPEDQKYCPLRINID